ncbi:MAG: M23 family metallopeptidase [Clostridia bacterium]|nr:M23 family metallopeptidase [Clostridia bacterium]
MLKKTGAFLEKWGYYFLAVLCAGAILASSFWVGNIKQYGNENAPAAADQAQHLADVTSSPPPVRLLRPAEGKVLRSFSEKPVYDPSLGLWLLHPYVDFEAGEGEKVYAMLAGTVEIQGDELLIRNDLGDYCLYRGLSEFSAVHGQQVKAGARIGTAGKPIPMEGNGEHLCIGYFRQGKAVNFLPLIAD